MPSRKVSDEDLVVAYVTGESLIQIATTLGITTASIGQRVKKMRKAGVLLPELKEIVHQRVGIDVSGLNKLIGKHLKFMEAAQK